ncbi:MAG: hypothetical protein MK102_09780 [Fuerstiella sp.]|nr:hypothetical protein [Fuerstiella sp.]
MKLHFPDTRKTVQTPSKFSVSLNGEQVAEELTLNHPDQTNNVIVHEVDSVAVTDSLTIELTGQQGSTLLNAVEVMRIDWSLTGCQLMRINLAVIQPRNGGSQ